MSVGAQAQLPFGHAPTGTSGTRTLSALPQPGGNVARLLRGPHQQGPPEGIPGGHPLPTVAPKRKKQRSKKGGQPLDGSGSLNPAASASSLDRGFMPLDDQSGSAGISSSGACLDVLSSSSPLQNSATEDASVPASEHSQAGLESIAAGLLAAAAGQ